MFSYCPGYISSFFFCDCITCCRQKSTAVIKKCESYCSHWFLRQWSPKEGESCRYRKDYAATPNRWCSDLCAWKALERNASLQLSDIPIPNINGKTAAHCTRMCAALILGGVQMDYDTVFTDCTIDFMKCITPVEIIGYNVTTPVTSQMITSAPAYTQYIDSPYSYGNRNPFTHSNFLVKFSVGAEDRRSARHFLTNRFSPALKSMHDSGVPLRTEKGVENKVEFAASMTTQFPVEDVGPLMTLSYTYFVAPVSRPREFEFIRRVDIDGCTKYAVYPEVRMVDNIEFQYEVYVRISPDPNSLFPLTTSELRDAVQQKPDWSNLEFTNQTDDSIVMKEKGSALMAFHIGYVIPPNESCTPVGNCVDPNTSNACKCVEYCNY